jgi:hypothetical protein
VKLQNALIPAVQLSRNITANTVSYAHFKQLEIMRFSLCVVGANDFCRRFIYD